MEIFVVIGEQGKIKTSYQIGKGTHFSERIKPKVGENYFGRMDIYPPGYLTTESELRFRNDMHAYCQEIYADWGHFGPYGDLLIVAVSQKGDSAETQVINIQNMGWSKPYLASDIVPIIEDKNGKKFFIGIIRGRFGAGHPGLIGGKREVHGYDFETASQNILKESEEEAEIVFTTEKELLEEFLACPYEQSYQMLAVLGNLYATGKIGWLGIYQTGRKEYNNTYGFKRVNETCAYWYYGKVDCELSEKIIRENIKAGDDAKDLHIVEVINESSCPEFYNDHHKQIFLDALKKIEKS